MPAPGLTAGTDVAAVQRRTLATLVTTQSFGGIGVSTAVSVNALLAKDVSGSEQLAGLAQTCQVLGGALVTLVIARIIDARGRRVGLAAGYAVGVLGALTSTLAGALRSFPLLMLGAALIGATTAANNQSRYAATDLAPADRRGRHLSLVVWSTTIGSVLGPNLTGPGGALASRLGLPPLTGPYLFTMVGVSVAVVVMLVRLRPDPLLVARQLAARQAGSGVVGAQAEPQRHGAPPEHTSGWSIVRHDPLVRAATLGLALSYAVMVSVMVMTPIHMDHGHATLEIIGLVISIHILGMFAFSPLVGLAVDRWGPPGVLATGGMVLLTSLVFAGLSPAGSSWTLGVGLFLLGVGWSLATVAASTLVTAATTPTTRPLVQGVTDLVTGLTAAVGGGVAGFVVGGPGFGVLNLLAGVLAFGVVLAAVLAGRHVTRPGRLATER